MTSVNAITSGYLPSGNGHIYVTHHPSPADVGSVVLVPPYGEERKSSYRLLFEMACMLAESGWNVYRFDPRGMGESTGAHREMTLETWQEDVAAVVNGASPGSDLWLLGARLGANIAARYAGEATGVNGLILWEPLLTGHDLLRDLIRRKQIKEMMGQGQAESAETALNAQWSERDAVDFDGFEMGMSLRDGLLTLNLVEDINRNSHLRILLCHIGGAKSFNGDWAAAAEMLTPPSKAVCIYQKPFWGLLDYQECQELKEQTQQFLEEVT